MKKFVATVLTVVTLLSATSTTVFANVIHSNGATGQPVAVGSNLGSIQGQTNRSSTGTREKATNDGWRVVVD